MVSKEEEEKHDFKCVKQIHYLTTKHFHFVKGRLLALSLL